MKTNTNASNAINLSAANTAPSSAANGIPNCSDFSLAGAVNEETVPATAGVPKAVSALTLACNGTTVQVADYQVHQELSECVDSMLFDSDTNIAYLSAKTSDGRFTASVDLMVRGEVSVTYKGKTYRKPSQFPKELRDRIKAHPGSWEFSDGEKDLSKLSDEELSFLMEQFDPDNCALEDEDELYISCNNWFEYIYTVRGEGYEQADGVLFEENLATLSNDDLQVAMLTFAKEVIEIVVERCENAAIRPGSGAAKK